MDALSFNAIDTSSKQPYNKDIDTVSYSQDIPEDGKVRCTPVHNHQYSATLKNEKAYEALRGSSALHRVSKISLKSSLKLS
jgi:NAD(P)H-dependent FMN reductase